MTRELAAKESELRSTTERLGHAKVACMHVIIPRMLAVLSV